MRKRKKKNKIMPIILLVLLVVSGLLTIYNIYVFFGYFTMGQSVILVISLILSWAIVLVLWLTKRYKLGVFISSLLIIGLIISGIIGTKANKVIDDLGDLFSEDYVEIITSTTNSLQVSDSFVGKKIAIVKDDGYKDWGLTVLNHESKYVGLVELEYSNYLSAYNDLIADKIDLMIYSSEVEGTICDEDNFNEGSFRVLYRDVVLSKVAAVEKIDINSVPFVILINGVDLSGANINKKARADSNILVVINPKTSKMVMQVIPRDLLVPIACREDKQTKLNRAGSLGGVDCSIATIENYFGIKINYYAKINFSGFVKVIDSLGGITVSSKYDYCVGEYCFVKGSNKMDGEKALMFVRARKMLPGNDLARGNNQIAVMKAVFTKIMKEPSYDKVLKIVDNIQKNFVTNIPKENYLKLFTLMVKVSDQLDLESYTMKGENKWPFKSDPIYRNKLYYFIPDAGEVEKVISRINEVLGK